MGIPDSSSFLDLIEKFRSWIPWGGIENQGFSRRRRMCCECKTRYNMDSSLIVRSTCQGCGQLLCGKCLQVIHRTSNVGSAKEYVKLCKFCVQDSMSTGHELVQGGGGGGGGGGENNQSVHSSPQTSPVCQRVLNNDNIKFFQSSHLARFLEAQYGPPMHSVANSSVASSTGHPSPVSFRRSSSRSDEEDAEDSGKPFFSPSSEYFHDISDVDSSSISTRHEFYSFKSLGSSPLDSPSRVNTPTGVDISIHQEQDESLVSRNGPPFHHEAMASSRRTDTDTEEIENTDYGSDDLSAFRDRRETIQKSLDFEDNGLIWFPPPPDDEDDEMGNNFFEFDDEDDDVGESAMMFSSSSFSAADIFPFKEKQTDENKEPLRAAVHQHFRALVLQLLQNEGICAGSENGGEGWLDIVTSVAWEAANFVKPDTRKGGSMDPGDYVKVKCIASGSPCQSTLIKGVVCTKNIKHKRMTSQYKNPRLLLLGGALEYQRASNQLASFDTLLQQEMDHLKMIVSRIEAHRPNVLLVEKSVSSYAQEYLLAKEISLVLNVKRPLLERIARCTGAHIIPSVDNLSSLRLGHCESFNLERVLEETTTQPSKKSAKTLMFFEGCPRRLGCTVLLKGATREVLKKVKHVVQFAVFAAYHLSLETCFLADEGATLPEVPLKDPIAISGRLMDGDAAGSALPNSVVPSDSVAVQAQDSHVCSPSKMDRFHLDSDAPSSNNGTISINLEVRHESSNEKLNPAPINTISPGLLNSAAGSWSGSSDVDTMAPTFYQSHCKERRNLSVFSSQHDLLEISAKEDKIRAVGNQRETAKTNELATANSMVGKEVSSDYFSTVDNHQSILVSFSSRCVHKGTICERSQLLRIKFYGSFDKPLGRYLQDDLFNQTTYCRSCKESTDAHVRCFTHQQGNLTISVRRLPSVELPGERDGKMWMWHRCLKCAQIDGVPPATRRVIMSDAAWGLSFGKFLELSFSNHATANRIASCGHSLQRDCLRYYGLGGMVAFFRYSPIDILSVRLPPSILEFDCRVQQEWAKREAMELSRKMEVLYAEVFDVLHNIKQKGLSLGHKQSDDSDFHSHVTDLKALLKGERNEYQNLLQPADIETTVDILELNRLRRCLLIDSYIWDRRFYSLESLLRKKSYSSEVDLHMLEAATYVKLREWRDNSFFEVGKLGCASEENKSTSLAVSESPKNHILSEQKEELNLSHMDPVLNDLTTGQLVKKSVESDHVNDVESTTIHQDKHDELNWDVEVSAGQTFSECLTSPASTLSDKIDSAWTGTGQRSVKAQVINVSQLTGNLGQAGSDALTFMDNPSSRRLRSPMRVHSFDSALRIQEKIRKGPSLHLSSLRSFHASGDYRNMVRDPIPDILKNISQKLPKETQKLQFIFSSMPSFISSASQIAGEGFWSLLSQTICNDMVIPVYDNEPTSVIAYALGSNEHHGWILNKYDEHQGGWNSIESSREDDFGNPSGYHCSTSTTFPAWQSLGSVDSGEFLLRSHGTEDTSSTKYSLVSDPKRCHFKVSFGDETLSTGKVKFSVVCYFARQFDALRQRCCSEVDFIRSLSRCSKWNAQGGKSNVYFAKSFDERFIIKQVTKTELDSFEEFAPEYFKYLTDSLSSGSPTCLAKVLGIYQVTVKHLRSGRESKMDLMVMENLFFRKSISKVYDLKGSARSRYNPDASGKNKVLLDMNLLETLRTNPIFLSSKAKRTLERAVWNDTSFLASIDVMDYSLLVGIDEERNELVLGIIDYMRQYTWDKHLETWVKVFGILGGPKNASPTVVSPKQYKKRFRKAMSTYFLTVPDQWST